MLFSLRLRLLGALLPALLLLLVATTPLRAQGLVPDSTELRVLRQFYYATGGPTWNRNDGWLTGTTLADVAGWYGVQTNGLDVVWLDLPVNHLTGSLPACLGLLRGLEHLSIWQSWQLSGPLPPEWGNLDHLRVLGLSQNGLTGPVPPEWGRLRQLHYLSLHTNGLSGPLPVELSRLTRLQYLNLYGNRLSGPIPDSVARLRRLRTLDLAANPLTGPLPAALGQLDSLETLQLWQNDFRDSIPAAWAGMRRLRTLNMAQSAVIGRLPRALGDLPQLEVAGFYMNHLRGPVPAELGQLRHLVALDLSYNQLSGPLPQQLGRLSALARLSLQFNQLSGPLPDSLGRLRQLQHLWLHNNGFTGTLPATLGRLTQLLSLGASDNRLSGSLPDSLARCAALQTLVLSNNQFSGLLPAGWSALHNLNQLLLANNQLSGSLPSSWTTLPQLYLLYLERNQLSGPLPGLPPSAQQVNLAYNRFEGPLPASLGSLSGLSSLLLPHNRFTGPLPPALGQLTQLGYLSLAGNRFTGSIPAAWGQLTGLLQLDLSRNRLSGTVPAGILRLPGCMVWLTSNQLTGVEATAEATLPVRLDISANHLDFGALEALATGPDQPKPAFLDARFQHTRTPADTQYVVHGTRPWVARRVGGTHNHYAWQYRVGEQLWLPLEGAGPTAGRGTPTPVATADSVQLGAMNESLEREYRVAVTNDWFPGTVLYSRGRYLSLLPYAPPARNEPKDSGCPALADVAPADRTGAQDSVNFVRTYTARAAFTDPAQLRAAPARQAQVQTQYLDGLGRPVQTVQHQASPTGRDVVQPMAYDALGRQPKQYLPYTVLPAAGAAGAYRPNALHEQFSFYHTPTAAGIPATGIAYAETAFEASPLNRVLAQAAPGETWQLHTPANHAVHTLERPNNADQDTVRRWRPGYGTEREDLTPDGVYAPGALWVQQVTDEQGQLTRSYTDPEGRLVLKQVSLGRVNKYAVVHADEEQYYQRYNWLSTYYVYDDFGRQRAVIPPLAEQRLRAHNWVVDGAVLERLLFRYHYDAQGRLIEKKIPDQDGYALTVYDELDRPVLTQDVAQRARAEWIATKYDTLGRVVLTALVRRPNQTRDQLQTAALAAKTLSERPATVAGPGGAYYTNRAWPVLAATDVVLSTTEYDSYDFDHNGTADARYLARHDGELGQAGYQAAPDARTTGQVTRTRTRVLGVAETAPGAWLTATSFTDEKGRVLQVQSTNARGLRELVTTRYDFAGQVQGSYAVHQGPHGATTDSVLVRETPRYDFAGRLLATTQTLGHVRQGQLQEGPATTLAKLRYTELGQVLQKHLGDSTAATALQTVDFTYNVRGWLTQVNNPTQLTQPDQKPDLFGLQLHYDCGFQTAQYNGNLSGQTWRSASDNVQRAYGYSYDQANRLQQGDFVARTGPGATAPWGAERDNYRFWAASYDANGNLLTMRRRGLVQEASRTTPRRYGETDNLRYRYQPASGSAEVASNRLLRVDDLAPDPATFGTMQPQRPDFRDGATTGTTVPDYAYDVAGGLTSDKNKGIARIRYNHLRLPASITWQSGDSLQFRYSAAGVKVAKLAYDHTKSNQPVRTDYLGPWQYEGDSLRWLSHSEGRALYHFQGLDPANQAKLPLVTYEYTLKDHLGNLRVAFHQGSLRGYRAELEPDTANTRREQHEFEPWSVSAPIRIASSQFAHLSSGAARVVAGGSTPTPIGPFKQLAVAKGDQVRIDAWGSYIEQNHNTNWTFSLASFVASLLQQPATTTIDGPTRRRVLPLLSVGLSLLPPLQQFANGVPKAYVRLLVYDADSNLVATQSQTLQLTEAAQGDYEPLTLRVTVEQAGFVQAYVANESDTEVYFDDITVQHQQGLQVQETQYDPYGLELAGLSRAATPENKFTWNGKERQDEFGLRWHDHGWRFYDPTLGRWVVTDPDAEEGDQESWGVYQFGLDNAVRYNDLDGRAPGGPTKEQISLGVHTALDVIGLVPGFGEVADGANALIYLAEGNKTDAALSAAAMIPFAGVAATGAKFLRTADKAVGALKAAEHLASAGKGASRLADKGGDAARAVKKACGCFTAGTTVRIRRGSKPIEQVQVGDSVWAYNERTRQPALRPVTHLFRYERDTVYVLHTAGGEALRTTSDHPFYVRGRWVRVKRLRVGDSLVSQSGQRHVLRRIELRPERVTVYNFTVDELHTYYVGQSAILVHNSGPCPINIDPANKIDRGLLDPPTKRGNAPTFKKDGTKVEIHHEGQNPNGPFREMHWEDHRGKGNDKINHPNKGQQSQIDRKAFRQQAREYWLNEFFPKP